MFRVIFVLSIATMIASTSTGVVAEQNLTDGHISFWGSKVQSSWTAVPHALPTLSNKIASNIRNFIPANMYVTHSNCLEYNKKYSLQSYLLDVFDVPGAAYKVGPDKYLVWKMAVTNIGPIANYAGCNVATVSTFTGLIQAVSINNDSDLSIPAVTNIYVRSKADVNNIALLISWADVRQKWILENVHGNSRPSFKYFIVRVCYINDIVKGKAIINLKGVRCRERKYSIGL